MIGLLAPLDVSAYKCLTLMGAISRLKIFINATYSVTILHAAVQARGLFSYSKVSTASFTSKTGNFTRNVTALCEVMTAGILKPRFSTARRDQFPMSLRESYVKVVAVDTHHCVHHEENHS